MLLAIVIAVFSLWGLWIVLNRLALQPGAPYIPDKDSGYVEVSDARLHYSKHGSGPVLVLIHGLGASSFIWRFVTPIWAEHFTVVTLDLPGFGRSSKALNVLYGLDAQARRAAEALTGLGIDEAILVGSSMGGAVALWMAHLWPRRFQKVAALAPATHPRLVPRWMPLYRYLSPIARFALNKKTLRPFVVNAVGRPDIVTSEALDSYLEPFRDRNALKILLLSTTQLLRDARLPGDLRNLQSRVLLLYGEKDRVVPRALMTELQSVLPHVTLQTHPTAGHHSMEDEPGWVAREIAKFSALP